MLFWNAQVRLKPQTHRHCLYKLFLVAACMSFAGHACSCYVRLQAGCLGSTSSLGLSVTGLGATTTVM